MKNILVLLCFMISIAPSFAQHHCGTNHEIEEERLTLLPYFGNMSFLHTLVDSVNNPAHRYSGDHTTFQLPVKFWRYDDFSTPEEPEEPYQLEAKLNEVNEYFTQSGLSIFLYSHCEAPLIEDPEMARGTSISVQDDRRGANQNPSSNTNQHWGAINFHFVETMGAAGISVRANAVFPWNEGRYTIVSRHELPSSGWAHEIGHTLGLLHVHHTGMYNFPFRLQNGDFVGQSEIYRYQEPRDNSRTTPHANRTYWGRPYWEHTGDLLEDTPGVPGATPWAITNCDYDDPNYVDYYGDPWQGSGMNKNFMAWDVDCFDHFTPDQMGVMYFWAKHYSEELFADRFFDRNVAHYENPNVDLYENDNYWQNARMFSGDPHEERSFHNFPQEEYLCDEDWVYFDVENQRRWVYISSDEVTAPNGAIRPSPPMRMELFRMDWASNTPVPVTLQTAAYAGNSAAEESDVFVHLIEELDTGRYLLRLSPNDPILTDARFYSLTISQNEDIGQACVQLNGNCYGGSSTSPTADVGAICGNAIPLEIQGLTNPPHVIWAVNVPDLTVTSTHSSGNPATLIAVNPAYRGPIEVTATLNTASGDFIGVFRFRGWYGPPAVPSIRAGGVVCLREEGDLGSQITFAPNDLLFATDNGGADPGFFFEIYNSNGNLVESGTVPTANQAEYHPMMASLNAGQYTARVTVQNACGAAQNRVRFQVDHCTEPGLESFGRAFPNPTNDWVTFALEDEIPLSEAGLHLKLYDNMGSLRLEKQENSREVSLNLYELPAGLYNLHVHNGEQFMQVQIVKE
jgi:hypothetical protein